MLVSAFGAGPWPTARAAVAGERRDLAESMHRLGGDLIGALADRPFAFAVVHRPTGAVPFAGYIADPGHDPGPTPAQPKAVH